MDEENLGFVVADFSEDPGKQRKWRKNITRGYTPRRHKSVEPLGGRLRHVLPNVKPWKLVVRV
jgi:hypothetical protein